MASASEGLVRHRQQQQAYVGYQLAQIGKGSGPGIRSCDQGSSPLNPVQKTGLPRRKTILRNEVTNHCLSAFVEQVSTAWNGWKDSARSQCWG